MGQGQDDEKQQQQRDEPEIVVMELQWGFNDASGKREKAPSIYHEQVPQTQLARRVFPGKQVDIVDQRREQEYADDPRQAQAPALAPEKHHRPLSMQRRQGEIARDEKKHRHQKHVQDRQQVVDHVGVDVVNSPPRGKFAVCTSGVQYHHQQHHQVTEVIQKYDPAPVVVIHY